MLASWPKGVASAAIAALVLLWSVSGRAADAGLELENGIPAWRGAGPHRPFRGRRRTTAALRGQFGNDIVGVIDLKKFGNCSTRSPVLANRRASAM